MASPRALEQSWKTAEMQEFAEFGRRAKRCRTATDSRLQFCRGSDCRVQRCATGFVPAELDVQPWVETAIEPEKLHQCWQRCRTAAVLQCPESRKPLEQMAHVPMLLQLRAGRRWRHHRCVAKESCKSRRKGPYRTEQRSCELGG